jgi:hypothetical protein
MAKHPKDTIEESDARFLRRNHGRLSPEHPLASPPPQPPMPFHSHHRFLLTYLSATGSTSHIPLASPPPQPPMSPHPYLSIPTTDFTSLAFSTTPPCLATTAQPAVTHYRVMQQCPASQSRGRNNDSNSSQYLHSIPSLGRCILLCNTCFNLLLATILSVRDLKKRPRISLILVLEIKNAIWYEDGPRWAPTRTRSKSATFWY